MAPELIKGQRKYGPKVDIWSYGIFAYELTKGDPPYINEKQSRAIILICKNDPPKIDEKWSPLFRDFVSKCLVKDPNDRWSAEQLLEHDFLLNAQDYKQEFSQVVNDFKVIDAEEREKKKLEKEKQEKENSK